MPPKPRPRARAPATVAITTDGPSSPGPSSVTTQPPSALSLADEDALFMRNQTRSAKAWAELSKMTEEKKPTKRKSASSDSSDSERNVGSSPRTPVRKKRQPSRKNNALPAWTKKKPNEIDLSSDSEDDIILLSDGMKSTAKGDGESTPRAKNKVPRSRSITPPPALTQQDLYRAKTVVQQFIGNDVREPSPTDGAEELTDNIALNPELASIARRVQTEAKMRGTTPADDLGGPEQVQIKVLWKPHPLNPDGKSDSWGFVQKRHSNFYQLFDEVADLASVRTENLVVCYKDKRVFASSNPRSIGIWAEAELAAYEVTTYKYLRDNRRIRSPSVAPQTVHSGTPFRERSPSVQELSDSESAAGGSPPTSSQQSEESQTFRITVRSERTKDKDITLNVRPTTKCGAIVRAFLRKAGLEAEYPTDGAPVKGRGRGKAAAKKPPALSVDGEKMDAETEIAEADLEDGDLVEVVGL